MLKWFDSIFFDKPTTDATSMEETIEAAGGHRKRFSGTSPLTPSRVIKKQKTEEATGAGDVKTEGSDLGEVQTPEMIRAVVQKRLKVRQRQQASFRNSSRDLDMSQDAIRERRKSFLHRTRRQVLLTYLVEEARAAIIAAKEGAVREDATDEMDIEPLPSDGNAMSTPDNSFLGSRLGGHQDLPLQSSFLGQNLGGHQDLPPQSSFQTALYGGGHQQRTGPRAQPSFSKASSLGRSMFDQANRDRLAFTSSFDTPNRPPPIKSSNLKDIVSTEPISPTEGLSGMTSMMSIIEGSNPSTSTNPGGPPKMAPLQPTPKGSGGPPQMAPPQPTPTRTGGPPQNASLQPAIKIDSKAARSMFP